MIDTLLLREFDERLQALHYNLGSPMVVVKGRPVWNFPPAQLFPIREQIDALRLLQQHDMQSRALRRPSRNLPLPTLALDVTEVWLTLDRSASSRLLDPVTSRAIYTLATEGSAVLRERHQHGDLRLRLRAPIDSPKARLLWADVERPPDIVTLSKAGLLLQDTWTPTIHNARQNGRRRRDRVEIDPLCMLGSAQIYDEDEWQRAKKSAKAQFSRGTVKAKRKRTAKVKKARTKPAKKKAIIKTRLTADVVYQAAVQAVTQNDDYQYGDRVFLAGVIQQLETLGYADVGDQLIQLHTLGEIELSRCDLPWEHDEQMIRASTLRHLGAEFHRVSMPGWVMW